MSYFQVNDRCNGCLACVQNCPANALRAVDGEAGRVLSHNMTRCARCGNCWRICPQEAVEFQFLLKNEWDEVKAFDLVYCHICGDPLYTVDFGKTLSGKLDKTFKPVCSRHREELPKIARAHCLPGRPGIMEA